MADNESRPAATQEGAPDVTCTACGKAMALRPRIKNGWWASPCYPECSSPRPAATGSKARAEEIARGLGPRRNAGMHSAYDQGLNDLLRALDRAGFFADETALAEIRERVEYIASLEHDRAPHDWRLLALRLASAVRKLGIGGKP